MTPDASDNSSPGAPEDHGASDPLAGRPPHSRLAYAALALALVPCCPAVALGGSMLGVLAHARIRRSGGRLRGERMAVAAMLLGSVLALVQMLILERYIEEQAGAQRSAAVAAVRASLEDDAGDWPAAALEVWAESAAMDAAALRQGVDELEAELGAFVGIRLADVRPAGRGLALGRVWTGFISTGTADRPAVVEGLASQTPGQGWMGILPEAGVRLRAIRVILADGREVVIGTPFGEGPGEGPDETPAETPDETPDEVADDADASDADPDPDTLPPSGDGPDSESSGG